MGTKLIYDGRTLSQAMLDCAEALATPAKERITAEFDRQFWGLPFGYGISDDPESRSLQAVESPND